MVVDIVPELLTNIQNDFNSRFNKSTKLNKIRKLIDDGNATYEDANEYAVEVGRLLAQSYKKYIKSDTLPDGKMYYNIAERILNPTLGNNHTLISKISADVQTSLNASYGIGIKGVEAPLQQNRINGIIERVATEEVFDNVAWILNEPIVNFSQSVVDSVIETNVDFHGKSGLSPKVIRTVRGHDPCEWCVAMAGEYKYPDVPKGVYARHDRCRCTVEYDPGDSKRKNVWS